MTSLAPPPPRLEEPDLPRRAARRWSDRLLSPVAASPRIWAAHALALAVVLGAVFLVVGHHQVVDADEGAALTQAQLVQRTGQWAMPATSELDPDGSWFPVHNSSILDDQAFVFTRPPLYPALIGPVLEAGGLVAVLVLHVVALWLTALGAGAVAERLRPGRGIQTMWLAGALSPLLFDGYWVIAHTLAAAGAVWAAWAAIRVVFDRRWLLAPVWLVGTATAACLRSEGLLYCAALAVGLLAVVNRDRWPRAIALSAGTFGIAGGSWLVMNAYQRWAEGGSDTQPYRPGLQGGVIAGRLKGFEHAVLSPGTGAALGTLLVALTAILLGVALVGVRVDALRSVTPKLAIGAAMSAGLRMLLPIDLVTGLLMAAPLIVVAAVLVPVAELRRAPVRFVAVTTALTALAVAASMHEYGGGGEWGGRYFHVALPLACVLAVLTMDWLLAHRGEVARTVVLSGLVVSLALSVLAVRENRGIRDVADILTETAWRTATTTRSADEPGGPVVVSTWVAGGRFSWRHILDGRYLTVDEPDEFPELGRRLAAAGVPDFTILAEPLDHDQLDEIGSGYEVTRSVPLGDNGWTVAVLSRR